MPIKPLIMLAGALAIACAPVATEADDAEAPATPSPEAPTPATPVPPTPVPATPESGTPDTGYRAGGNEPFWQLTFGEVSMDFSDMGMEERASALIPDAEATANGWRFATQSEGRPYVAEIERRFCQDSMSARPFPHTVRVTANGRRFEGCGGDTASLLTGGEWRVTALEGAPAASRAPTMTFADGAVTGNASCNRYRAPFEIAGDGGLAIGPAASTRMACAEARLNAQETRFLALLDSAERFDIAENGSLRLYALDFMVIEARR